MAFNKLRHSNIKGEKGSDWNIEIWKDGFSGSSTEFDTQGEGFEITWNGSGGTRVNSFLGSECSLNIYIQNSTDETFAQDVLSSGFQSYYIRIYKGNVSSENIWWFGWIQPSFDKVENGSFPYVYTLTATDSIGYFNKKKPNLFTSETDKNDSATIVQTFLHYLSLPTSLDGISIGGENYTNIVSEGTFPDPNTAWTTIQPTWNIPSGGGRIDYNGTSDKYIEQTGLDIDSSETYTVLFNISNLAPGDSAIFQLIKQNSLAFFTTNPEHTYTSNGNYSVTGTTSSGISGLRFTTRSSDTFSLTDIVLLEGDVENATPSPINSDWLRTSSNWWRNGDESSYGTVNPLSLYYISQGAFAEETKFDDDGTITSGGKPLEYKQQDVFNGLLRLFNLKGFLAEGKYNFIQPNLLATNANGDLLTYSYSGFLQPTNSDNISTQLTIDQSIGDNVILGGSNFIYEPPLESATIEYTQQVSSFNVSLNTDIESTEQNVGYTNENTGIHTLKFVVRNKVNVLKDDFNFDSNHDVFNNTYRNSCDLIIKLSNGTDDYYLQEVQDTNELIWTLNNSTPLTLEIRRGYFISYSDPINNSNLMDIVGGASNNNDWNSSDSTPCKRTQWTSWDGGYVYHYEFDTLIRFTAKVSSPPISGSITMSTSTSNDYYQRTIGQASIVDSINNPTPEQNTTKVIEISYTPTEDNDTSNVNKNVTYRASQTDTLAWDVEDLGSSPIGQRLTEEADYSQSADKLYSIQYMDGNIIKPAVEGFREGSSDEYRPILQLVVNEYLDLQSKPLEILQGKIQSADISPLKMIKYSVNQDGANFKNYAFLGGTFSARSEIMSGEWYNVRDYSVGIIDNTPEMSGNFSLDPLTNLQEGVNSSLKNIGINTTSSLTLNAFCTLTSSVSSGTPITTLTTSNLLGAINDNQNITITFPDGSNGYILQSSADKYPNGTSISIDSWTPATDYPIGSLINLSLFDVPSMINERSSAAPTPAGSDTEMQFNDAGNMNGARYLTYDNSTGITTYKRLKTTAGEYVKPQPLYVKILPSDFIADDGGRPLAIDDSTSNRFLESHSSNVMFASVQIPFGYKATDVHIYGNGTSVMTVSEANINSRTVTSKGVGNIGTNLAITNVSVTTTNYILIELAQTSSEQVNGGIMTIALI
mgnify:CR=1 FL=1